MGGLLSEAPLSSSPLWGCTANLVLAGPSRHSAMEYIASLQMELRSALAQRRLWVSLTMSVGVESVELACQRLSQDRLFCSLPCP